MRKPTWVLSLAGSTALFAGTALQAQTDGMEEPALPRYAVEIILFRYADSVPSGNEVFAADPPPPAPEDPYGMGPPDAEDPDREQVPAFGDLAPAIDPPAGPEETATDTASDEVLEEIILPTRRIELAVTPKDALTLKEQYEKLELLDAYEPLLWTGWTQTALERDATPTIPLRRLGNPPAGFDGELQLYLSRFLHLVVDLTMTPRQQQVPAAYTPSYGDQRSTFDVDYRDGYGSSGIVRLRIDEDRIVKNGDLRYFDHPKFGLLAKVTRIEEEESGDPEADDDTSNVLPAEG